MNQGFFLLDTGGRTFRELFNLDAQTFIQILPILVNVVALFVLLTYLLYNPVRNFMARRSERIAAQLDEAEATKAAAHVLKDEYEQKLKDIEQERSAILDEARKLAAERRARELADAKKEAEAIKARAMIEIAAERDRVKDQVEQAIVDISAGMAGKLLGANIDTAAHSRLFDEALAELDATVFKSADASVSV